MDNAAYQDANLGFSFPLPAGLKAERRVAAEAYPLQLRDKAAPGSVRVTVYHEPRPVAEALFQKHRAENPAGVAYALYGQINHEGAVSEWALLIPAPAFYLKLEAGAQDKPLLLAIATGFRWTAARP